MKRTNIVVDEKLMSRGKRLTGIKTNKDLVDFALRQLVRHEDQKRILTLEGSVAWEGDLEQMRITSPTISL